MNAVDPQRPWASITPVVDSIARQAVADLNSRALIIPDITADPYRQKELLRQMVRETIDSYGTAVSDATMVWLEEQEDHMGMRPIEWKPRRVDSEQVEARMAKDFAPLFFEEQGYQRSLQSMKFIVADELYSRQRKNTEHTAWKGGGSWARVAHPGACAFCTLLASRGFDYTSRSTAGGGYSGAHFHDHCRCLVICRKRGHVELPESTIRAQKIYKKAQEEVDSTDPDVLLRAMRQVGDLST
ncbi:hypothetical protein [Corynebacterium rhinophilum]|uniref:VG15 protein n=1 Tax=Corynebacterium rhinophilum TaxID=3050197 RepID=UPI00254FBC54|nr:MULTISPECIES: hypothetical protein [unclassified Corynebacterium]MDK8466970.1 hypothetical protein [Corynebacterium sp. MSK130]MDK8687542.1 hypothetical protein [Corynebacterium sp. MSK122]